MPSIPAAGIVLGLRLLETGGRTSADAVLELATYVVVTVLATIAFERPLLKEIAGYLRPQPT
jgi:hypothetical protein